MSDRMFCGIPARGGSKRLARKNIRLLRGKPLIAYTIECALQSGLFPAVYVCTEDEEIAEIAARYGAKVPTLLPTDACGDLVPSHIPCQRVAAYVGERGEAFDSLVCLQPTSPLRSANDIRTAVEKYGQGRFDFIVSVTPVDPHDFHWAVVPGEQDYYHMYFGTEYMKERPLLPPVYRPNGSIKIARLETLSRVGHFFGERMGVVETPPERSVHVAQEFDLKLCETLLTEQLL